MALQVITVKQPHADKILFGSKWCENRSWPTSHRGPMYIHAAGAVETEVVGLQIMGTGLARLVLTR